MKQAPVVLFDPEAPEVPVVEVPKVKSKAQVVADTAATLGVPVVVAPVAAPASVEVASSEVGTEPRINTNPTPAVGISKEVHTMLNSKNMTVGVEGNTLRLTITDPKYRGEVTASQKSRKVAWAGGTVEIGGGLRLNVSVTKDGVTG